VLGAILVFPQGLIDVELGGRADALSPPELARAINDIRTTLLQGIGGVAVLLGAYFAYRQLQVNHEGQITERFTRAIDQLGHLDTDVRIGGIYALERIANDSSSDRATIAEVLAAFVRGHAPWPPPSTTAQWLVTRFPSLARLLRTHPLDPEWPVEVPDLQTRAPDVQAAVTVLGRRRPPPGDFAELNLQRVDLRNARLQGATLRNAQMFGANFLGAELTSADLRDTDLRAVNLRSANLPFANLGNADLSGAQLRRAELYEANLHGADLRRADLRDTYLVEADLSGAHLGTAQLQDADLTGAKLFGAVADDKTAWPEGFDWRAAGVVILLQPLEQLLSPDDLKGT
jgi:hypothetical protein